MEIKTEVIFDNGTEDFTFSLRKQKYIILNGEKQYIGEVERRAVGPLDMHLVEDFLSDVEPDTNGVSTFSTFTTTSESTCQHPIAGILSSIWTNEVQAYYKAKRIDTLQSLDDFNEEHGSEDGAISFE